MLIRRLLNTISPISFRSTRRYTNKLTGPIIRIAIKNQIKYLILLLFVAIAGCRGHKTAIGEPAQSTDMDLTLLLSDLYGGAEKEELRVIRNAEELKKCFAIINRTRKPGLPVPEIDFNQETALLYSPGKTKSREIPQLFIEEESEQHIIFGKKPVSPQKKGPEASASAILNPFAFYSLPKVEKEFTLSEN